MVAHPEKKHPPAAIVEDSAARDLLDKPVSAVMSPDCLLYTSDAADDDYTV